jgi:chromatin remodeling complex protein RSC6
LDAVLGASEERTEMYSNTLREHRNEQRRNAPNKEVLKNMAKENSAFMKPLKVSAELAAVVGNGPMPRSEVVKKIWVYIKGKNLQDPKNKRNIVADANLKKVFGGKDVVNMFEMTKLVSKHLS